MVLKVTLVFIFGPNLKTMTLLRPRPKLNNIGGLEIGVEIILLEREKNGVLVKIRGLLLCGTILLLQLQLICG